MNAYEKSRTWWKTEASDEMVLMSRDDDRIIGKTWNAAGDWQWECGDASGREESKEAAMDAVEKAA